MKTERIQVPHRKMPIPKYRQVTERLRDLLSRGELAPGDVLPTIHELAERFDTSYFTVQTALTPLVEQGLIERKRRVGTIVKRNSAVLTCAAIYSGSRLLDMCEEAFPRELCRQLQIQLTGRNVRAETYLDSRPQAEQHEPLPALARAVKANEVQALIVPQCDHVTLPWLRRLPVVASFTSGAMSPNRVQYDHTHMLRVGLGRLRERGCRNVGLICTIQLHPRLGSDSMERQFYDCFVETLADVGLTTRDAWMAVPRQAQTQLEPYGYAQFKALWEHPQRPDGILVYPDVAARGVMTAALELGVRVPDELKMVFHHNTGVDWVCPLAVDWVESDVARWAAEMIEQVVQQKAGKAVEPVKLEYELRGF